MDQIDRMEEQDFQKSTERPNEHFDVMNLTFDLWTSPKILT